MADQHTYPYPSPTTQLEQLAGAAQQASSPSTDYGGSQRPPNPRKRRADGSAASSRGVANLTPDQLAKKRANDREAQRAIRERTRNNIETLQQRIHDLESQQPFQELQSVIRSRDATVAENEELKRRLQNIQALSQYQQSGHGLNDLALATSQQAPLPTSTPQHQPAAQTSYPQAYPEAETPSLNQQHIHPDLRSIQSQQAPTAPMQATNGAGTSPRQTRGHSNKTEKPEWQRLPQHTEPTNALDASIQRLLSSHRTRLESGSEPMESVIGPPLPSFAALIYQPVENSPSLTAGIADIILHNLPSAVDLPRRVAAMYTMYFLMQWLIAPSKDMFERLPQWLRPTQLQLEREHAAWIDFLPWPQLRDRKISSPSNDSVDHFETVFSYCGLGWNYDADLCIMKMPTASDSGKSRSDDWVINPVFEAHIRLLDHWTLDVDLENGDVREGRDEGLEGLLQGLHGNTDAAS